MDDILEAPYRNRSDKHQLQTNTVSISFPFPRQTAWFTPAVSGCIGGIA